MERKLNIGIVAPFNPYDIKEFFPNASVPSINNGATSVNTLVRALLKEGHSVKVFTISNDVGAVEKLEGNNVEVFMIPTLMFLFISRFRHHLMLDSYYVHKRLTTVISTEVQQLDVLHAHWTYDFAESIIPFLNKLPLFVTVRDWAPLQYKMQKSLMGKIVWLIKLIKFKKVMGIDDVCYIANSEYTFRLIKSAYPNSRAVVIHNPIKKELVASRQRSRLFNHQFISVSVDLDEPRKNIPSLIDAFNIYKSNHPEACLHMVGAINKEGENYKHWRSSKKLEGVVFHGRMNHDELICLLDEMSCLVHPSLEETFGNVLVEAMARGVVCIGGEDSGAVPYVLNGGRAGLLCDVKDSKCLFESMNMLNEPDTYLDLVDKAYEWLKSNYMSDTIANKHISLYSESVSI